MEMINWGGSGGVGCERDREAAQKALLWRERGSGHYACWGLLVAGTKESCGAALGKGGGEVEGPINH